MTAYSPLGSPDSAEMMKRQDKQSVMDNPTVKEVALKHNKAAAEVRMSPPYQGLRLPGLLALGNFTHLKIYVRPNTSNSGTATALRSIYAVTWR